MADKTPGLKPGPSCDAETEQSTPGDAAGDAGGRRPGVGVVLSLAAGRGVESMLYGTSSRDAATFATVAMIIESCAAAACLIPARKAAGVDPAITLKE